MNKQKVIKLLNGIAPFSSGCNPLILTVELQKQNSKGTCILNLLVRNQVLY